MRKIFQFNLMSLVAGIWLIAAMLIQYPEFDMGTEPEKQVAQDYTIPLIAEDENDDSRIQALRIMAMNSQARRDAANRKSLTSKYLAELRLAFTESN